MNRSVRQESIYRNGRNASSEAAQHQIRAASVAKSANGGTDLGIENVYPSRESRL
jgi:hypothetical protein